MGLFAAREPPSPLRTAVSSRAGTPPPTTSGESNTPHTHSPSQLRLYLHPHLPRLRSHPNFRSSDNTTPAPAPALTSSDIVELRALQRTFEGAYMRTALSQFSFALLVLKIFTHEFYPIGALYAASGVCVFAVSILRRKEGNKQFFVVVHEEKLPDPVPVSPEAPPVGGRGQGRGADREGDVPDSGARAETEASVRVKVNTERWFRTSGNVVCAVTGVSVISYVALLVLILRLGR